MNFWKLPNFYSPVFKTSHGPDPKTPTSLPQSRRALPGLHIGAWKWNPFSDLGMGYLLETNTNAKKKRETMSVRSSEHELWTIVETLYFQDFQNTLRLAISPYAHPSQAVLVLCHRFLPRVVFQGKPCQSQTAATLPKRFHRTSRPLLCNKKFPALCRVLFVTGSASCQRLASPLLGTSVILLLSLLAVCFCMWYANACAHISHTRRYIGNITNHSYIYIYTYVCVYILIYIYIYAVVVAHSFTFTVVMSFSTLTAHAPFGAPKIWQLKGGGKAKGEP